MRNFIWICVIMVSCQSKLEMKSKQKEIIENYVKSYNQFDISGMMRDLSPTIVFENISGDKADMRLEGIQAFENQAKSAKDYFKSRKQTITSWEFKDNIVVIEIDYEAILAVDLPNGMKAGDTLKLNGQSVFVFEKDLVVAIRDKS